MRLFIAEKPSLGRAIADCLPGSHKKGNGFIETGDGTVTWCFGHILEAAPPEDYDPRMDPWPGDPSALPVIPKTWRLIPVPKAKEQLGIIRDLLKNATEIVHAGDPDREGQLLVDEVLEHLGIRKPVRRIWLSALDRKSVSQALSALESNDKFAPMREAARSRSQADWLVGMNLSRATTISARKNGNPVAVLTIGRVQTPTLALVVVRDREIECFVPRDYFQVEARMEGPSGSFALRWTPLPPKAFLDDEKRCVDRTAAEAVAGKVKGATGVLGVESAEKSVPPPLPYSLSALTLEASKKYGLSAKEVLDAAQGLYEKKLATYPRTDCEYLPENQLSDVPEILTALAKSPSYAGVAKNADPKIVSRAWNNAKITAHHAIVPTREAGVPGSLPDPEAKIFDLVVRRYLAQFYPPYRYSETIVKTELAGEPFRTTGKTPINLGWKAVDQGPEEEGAKDPEPVLPALGAGVTVRCRDAGILAKKTSPPRPYTDGTLVAAMKSIGKTLSDPEDRKKLAETDGLGTEATRAAIIENLLSRGYLEKRRKDLVSTPLGRALVDAVDPEVRSPATTALWERRLENVSRGQDASVFMREIEAHVRKLTASCLSRTVSIPISGKRCPECRSGVLRRVEGKYGPFLGCSGYPACRHIEKLPGAIGKKPAEKSRTKGSTGRGTGTKTRKK